MTENEFTPEEEALYARLFGPDAPEPTTTPHRPWVVRDGEGRSVVEREERPDRYQMKSIPAKDRRAVVICRNMKGRPSTLAVLVTSGNDSAGLVFWSNGSGRGREIPEREAGVSTGLGQDFAVDCRCGMTHEVDGGRLRSELLGLPRRRGGKTPTLDVLDVERVAW